VTPAADPGADGLPRTAWLGIDLDALAGNLAAIRGALPPGVLVEPVVKADAYGHGAIPVARALASAGADGLCVATYDEAIELRRAGIRLPILILYPIPPSLALDAARASLAVTASDVELLARTLAVIRAGRGSACVPRRRLRIHLEVETGLGRAGVSIGDAPTAARAILATPGTVLVGLWSHLGSPDDDARTAIQTARFGEAAALLRDGRVRIPLHHLAASGGILGGRIATFDSVRLGLAVYGLVPDDLVVAERHGPTVEALRPVMSLHARPVRVAELAAGTGISYGSSFVTARPSRIATLPVGYADGWSRAYSNRTSALVRGRRVPLVGTVAMDAVMADVTDVDGPPVTVDDEFVLLGEQDGERITAVELARARTTISWEVVASMARRLPRVYHSAAEAVGLRTLTGEKVEWHGSNSGMATSATSKSTRSSMQRT
jgi:alanine racemase